MCNRTGVRGKNYTHKCTLTENRVGAVAKEHAHSLRQAYPWQLSSVHFAPRFFPRVTSCDHLICFHLAEFKRESLLADSTCFHTSS